MEHVGGRKVALGNAALMQDVNAPIDDLAEIAQSLAEQGKTRNVSGSGWQGAWHRRR
ncbi:MAG: hypothetical protein QM744_15470 [Mesorhizobium sp.]